MLVAVTGASGLIGTALARRLEAEGHQVLRLTRSRPTGPGQVRWDPAAGRLDPDALAENQDAVIGQQLAEKWPAIVEAAAKPFASVDQMIVLNGAQGLSEAMAADLSQGVAGLQLARNLLSGGNGAANRAAGEAGERGSLQAPEAARKGRTP